MMILAVTVEAEPPSGYDLRNVNGTNYTTSVKNQSGGTCWAHGSLAAVEGNLIRHSYWYDLGYTNEPNLAEYHLDWWNGFNKHNNDDTVPPTGGGLDVHQGGDYLVTAAYATRGDGFIFCTNANDATESDSPWYSAAPDRSSTQYTRFYPRHIEWLQAGTNLQHINTIKEAIMSNGVIGTCMYYSGSYISGGKHYQPPSSSADPNHSIAIAGWDDSLAISTAPGPGAWLCKNSWGSSWNGDGYFWISYYDKHAGQHPEMGAVVFRDVIMTPYDRTYYHDFHGWRDTLATQSAFNAFTAQTNEHITAVSFYTASNNVAYTARLYRAFTDGALTQVLWTASGRFAHIGYHTVDLETPVSLTNGQHFYLRLDVDQGGQAYDCTSEISVLLNPEPSPLPPPHIDLQRMGKMSREQLSGTPVVSAADGGQSYYRNDSEWTDLTNVNPTANFCLKVFTAYPDYDDDGIPDSQDHDDDNDGMPDAWEILYGLNPTNAADGNADSDGDGCPNQHEYIAGTVPTNRFSVFQLVSAESSRIGSNTSIVLHWDASTGRSYSVFTATNLVQAFKPLTLSPLPHPCNTYTDILESAEPRGYYRVDVELNP
jgi:C1A family cysteine protease